MACIGGTKRIRLLKWPVGDRYGPLTRFLVGAMTLDRLHLPGTICYHVLKHLNMAPNRKAPIAPLWSREEGFDWRRIPAVVLSAGSAIESAGSQQEIVDHVARLIQDLVGLSYGVMGAAIDEPAIRALGLLSAQVELGLSRILLKDRPREDLASAAVGRGARVGSRGDLDESRAGRVEARGDQVGPRADRFDGWGLVGSGPAMKSVYRLVAAVAPSPSTVLILGETGTGKELIARAIHEQSPRQGKPMIKVNCAALPAELIESELFGHERGSFTGAVERRIGKFEQADGGTLFLDEIGEMPIGLQVRLLRALQEREIERIGGKGSIKVDVRVIAATNRDLEIEMAEGRFRRDLYYRLNIFPITLPPLRSRVEDIPALAAFFVERYAREGGKAVYGVSHSLLDEMKQYPWPGNVRELEHLIERSVLLSSSEVIRELPLPGRRVGVGGESGATAGSGLEGESPEFKTIDDMERDHISATLEHCRWRVGGSKGAANLLGVPPSTLFSKMKKLNIVRKFEPGP
jgi:transcriptional regulator with GAF, ATPase, and Fis domain